MRRQKRTVKEIVNLALPRLSKQEVEEAGNRAWERIEAEVEKRKDELAWRSIYGDGWSVPALDPGDLQVMTAIRLLGEKATGTQILHRIQKWTETPPIVSLALQRLEAEGLVTSSGTGDEWKRRWQVTEYGNGALHRAAVEAKPVADAAPVALEAEEELEGGLAEDARQS